MWIFVQIFINYGMSFTATCCTNGISNPRYYTTDIRGMNFNFDDIIHKSAAFQDSSYSISIDLLV